MITEIYFLRFTKSPNTNLPPEATTSTFTQPPVHVFVSVEHPKLSKTDTKGVDSFLSVYAQQVIYVQARVRQVGSGATGDKASRLVELKVCVDIEYIKYTMSFGLISSTYPIDDLSDAVRRTYVDFEALESRFAVTLPALDGIGKRELKMDMKKSNASSRVKNLFVENQRLLRHDGLEWLPE